MRGGVSVPHTQRRKKEQGVGLEIKMEVKKKGRNRKEHFVA